MDYSKVPTNETIEKTISALKNHGIDVILIDTKKQALEKILENIPEGSKIMNGSSTTLIQIGFSEMLKSGKHKWKNLHEDILKEPDYGKQSDLRRKALTETDYFLSSVNAITKDGKYITPKSDSILKSITNKSLMQIARDFGIVVEERAIEFSEIDTFDEVAACGTGLTITPISKIHRNGKDYNFNSKKEDGVLKKLYSTLSDIQFGRVEDRHNWMTQLD